MKIKTTFIALTLSLAPTLALAGGGCNWEKTQQSASSCAEGTVYDVTSGTCIPQTTS